MMAGRPRQRPDVDSAPVDSAKFFRGKFAMCPNCGCRPCAPGCPGPDYTPAIAPPEVNAGAAEVNDHTSRATDRFPAAGRAIDFRILDECVERFELDTYGLAVLVYLHRHTIGRWAPFGAGISLGEIARGLRIHRATVARRLNDLAAAGLIVRTRKHARGRRCFVATHIEVTLDAAIGAASRSEP